MCYANYAIILETAKLFETKSLQLEINILLLQILNTS